MTSIERIPIPQITKDNPLLSAFRTTIETAFYANNVSALKTIQEAYLLAKSDPGTIITDIPAAHTKELGLAADTKVLVTNDGQIVGRTAAARQIIGQPGVDSKKLLGILREAIYQAGKKAYRSGTAVVGLDKEFMLKTHLLLPESYGPNLYSYLSNFQIWNETYEKLYRDSIAYNEGDLYIFGDPDWSHPDFPHGLALFDPEHNCAAILGLRYFGEFKKATLTLAWATAHRNGFVACHGGMKQYALEDRNYTMAAFGLSGSGKSTITLAKHGDKYRVTVLHDDAFVISKKQGATTALEPAYYDKTQDYPMQDETIRYFLTVQNVGVTLDDANHKVLVTEDIRNGNGRTVKSRYVTPNRVDHLAEKIDAVYWIMKDDSLPPIVKVTDSVLAAIFGATLATKRSTAENVVGDVDQDKLVIEPFANPFRCYPLAEDYQAFHDLFAKTKADCYILNTGFFNDQKVTPHDTLSSIEKVVEETASFVPFGPFEELTYLPIAGHEPNFEDLDYRKKLLLRMQNRLHFIQEQKTVKDGYDALPNEAETRIKQLIAALETYALETV